MTYGQECEFGRLIAIGCLAEYRQTGNAPKLVREIREAAADSSGFSIGFLYEIAGRAAK